MTEKKKHIVPRLRFPEFRNAGPWEVKRLGEIAKVVRGGSPRPITKFLTTDENGLNWLKIGDIPETAKYVSKTEEKIHQWGLSATRKVHPGDLILSNSMSFGRPYIMKIQACIHDGWLAVTELPLDFLSEFIYYFILSGFSQRYLQDAAAGGGVRNLNAAIVKLLPVAFPPDPQEQQKIADCLSSLDEVIELETKKLEALKAHKRGLMQQLFPREGETTPRLRFPEFRNAGPWEVKRLGEVLMFQTGFPFSSRYFNETGDGIRLIRNADLKSSERIIFYSGPYDQTFIVNNGDILVGMDGDFSPSIWRHGKALLNQRVGRVFAKDGNSLVFLNYSLSIALKVIEHRTAQTTVKHLSHTTVEKTRWPIPSFPEQQKIADCLSSLDEVIELEARKLEALKAHKKGLMQQLFPQEVTP